MRSALLYGRKAGCKYTKECEIICHTAYKAERIAIAHNMRDRLEKSPQDKDDKIAPHA
jgi:hypothetical protein